MDSHSFQRTNNFCHHKIKSLPHKISNAGVSELHLKCGWTGSGWIVLSQITITISPYPTNIISGDKFNLTQMYWPMLLADYTCWGLDGQGGHKV